MLLFIKNYKNVDVRSKFWYIQVNFSNSANMSVHVMKFI